VGVAQAKESRLKNKYYLAAKKIKITKIMIFQKHRTGDSQVLKEKNNCRKDTAHQN
jgi:hypothetical protein